MAKIKKVKKADPTYFLILHEVGVGQVSGGQVGGGQVKTKQNI